ncbi:MAG: ribokinase, partial [Hyphomicrobiales bacterium]
VLARAGVELRFVATLGDDDNARWIRATLEAEGVATDRCIPVEMPSDRSLIFVGPEGENAIASSNQCADALTPQDAARAVAELAAGDVVLLQGGLTTATNRAACIAAKARGVRVVFNPSAMREGFAGLVPYADLLVLNRIEATQLAGAGEPALQAQRLHAQGAGDVVVTLGREGAVSAGQSGGFAVPAAPAQVCDSTGAGDTFLAVLAACRYARGLAMDRALHCAAEAAAITVSRAGTRAAFPTVAELAAILD